jgi:uncharacterized protein with PQ loop repeat
MLAALVSVLAPIFTCIQLIPQLYKTYITQKVDDLSFDSLLFITVGNLLWLAHGYYVKDSSLIIAGLFATVVNTALLHLYFVYRR